MDHGDRLYIRIKFGDDTVGAFDPLKVLQQLQRTFPEAEIDPTDHQQVRLLRELEFWTQGATHGETRENLVLASWGCYRRHGPTYRFVIPFASGNRVNGMARRRSVGFNLPKGLMPEQRSQLVAFLQSLRMGEPVWDDEAYEDAEPDGSSDDKIP